MIFSVTERANFRRCRRLAVLTSKNGRHLGPLLPPLHLSVGTIVHRAHQLWITQPERDLVDCAMAASVEEQEKARIRYTKHVGVPPSDDELLTLHESISFAVAMCRNYQAYHKTPLPPEYRLISAEQKIRIAIRMPRADTIHILEGRVDGLIQHIPTGRIDVLERKTYNQRPRQDALESADQFKAYVWMVRQLGFNTSLGVGIAYDGMWRREEPPRGKSLHDLFARYYITFTDEELSEFARFLPLELNEMAQLYNRPEDAYINRRWQGCWDCPFDGTHGLCRAVSTGDQSAQISILATQFTERDDDTEPEAETE